MVSGPEASLDHNHEIQHEGWEIVSHYRASTLCACVSIIATITGCAAQQQRTSMSDKQAVKGVPAMSLYNDTDYYNAVKNRWFGLGDYATDQPSR